MWTGSAGARRVAAALDFLALVLVAAAVVTMLGSDTRIRVWGIRLSISNVWRPLLLAAGVALVRWGIARRAPLLGAVAKSGLDDDTAVRTSVSERPLLPPRFGAVAVGLVLAALLPMRAQLAHLRSVPDLEDPLFSAWRVAWFAHQILIDPVHLFDANIFFPAPLTLTYSDAHLLPSVLAAPLIWLGAEPVIASNLLLVAALPLAALGYGIAAWRLVGDVRASVMAGLLAAWYPFHFEHITHLELQWFCWIPLAIAALHAAIARGGWARGALLGAAIAAQALSSMYLGLMLAAYLVPFCMCLMAGWRIRPTARLGHAALAAGLVALLPVLILGAPYLGSHAARGDRTAAEVTQFSATGHDYAVANVHSATWGPRIGRHPKPERGLFPGAIPIGLAAVGMLPPLTVTGIATIVSGALAFDWSLGVNGLTYDELRRLLLPVRGLRVPARFVVLVATSLILLAAFGVRHLLARFSSVWARNAVFTTLIVLAWIDLRPSFRLIPAWRQPPPIYAAVRPTMVLAEFPMRYRWNISYMYFSTTHWARLVNGYSGFLPDSFAALQHELAAFPDPAALALVRQQGATHITVNCRFYGGDEGCAPVLAGVDQNRGLRLVASGRWQGAEVRLYELGF